MLDSIMTAKAPEGIRLVPLQKDEESPSRRCSRGPSRSLELFYKRIRPETLKSMILIWFLLLVVVLLANVILALVLFSRPSAEGLIRGVYRTVRVTDYCKTMEHQINWIHLLINVLSTAVLAASGFFMQLLSSPTRLELDALHANHESRITNHVLLE